MGGIILKNKNSAAFNIAAALLLALGPWFLFKTCGTEVKIMKCFWTSRAEIAIALILASLAVCALVSKEKAALRTAAAVSIVTSLMAAALPALLIGGCMKPDMACRTTTFPAIYLIVLANIAAQGVILFLMRKRG